MRPLAILAAIAALCAAGCSDGTERGDRAERVDDWPGMLNASRAGRFVFGGQPDEEGLRHAAAEGVKLVVNLRTEAEMETVPFDEPSLTAELGMRYVSIPVTPESFSDAQVDAFVRAIAGTNEPILVHCRSSNRVGGLWAASLARSRNLSWRTVMELGMRAGMTSSSMFEAVHRVAGPDVEGVGTDG